MHVTVYKNQLLTRGAGEDLKSVQQLQLDVWEVLQSGHGEDQSLSQVAALQELQPVAHRGPLVICRSRAETLVNTGLMNSVLRERLREGIK